MSEVKSEQAAVPDINEQIQVRREKLTGLQQEGNNPYAVTKFDVTGYTKDLIDNFETTEGKVYSLAGRIMSWRDMGKASFMDIQDSQGRMQLYLRINDIGEDVYAGLKSFDIGDIIGVSGEMFVTRRGQISLHVREIKLLSKSLVPLPEKFHGLKDTDIRYRQRYLDLIVNPDVKDTFIKRSKIISAMRRILDEKGFLEVETPVLQTIHGGASARPFETHHNTLDLDLSLRIALELYHKRLIVGGYDKVYEIGRVFRNEGISVKHNPEFTLIELYQAYTDYEGMMNLTEEIFKYCADAVCESQTIEYGDITIDMSKSFERISMVEVVKKYSGVDFDEIADLAAARAIADERNIEYKKHHLKGDILGLFFDRYAEEKLVQPTFVIDYPVEISPFAKRKEGTVGYTERFELFILGREHANAFSELNDPFDQRERFLRQVELKDAGDDEATPMDEDFIKALEYGMPPTGGLGIGIDRMVMLFTDSPSIRDVLFFPTMRPQK